MAVANLTAAQTRIQDDAISFARKNKKIIAKRLTDKSHFPPEENPVSVFMAGSPGAGKTEASIALLEDIEGAASSVLRIDPDELRHEFTGYQGDNSWLFQAGVSILVEKIHDFALKNKQSFLLDGTLTNYDIARKNIKRSLDKKRLVQILYVYQEPAQAWHFVLAREKAEGRQIRPETFIDQYFAARDAVNRLKAEFRQAIQVDLLLKNNDGSNRVYKDNVDRIDHHIPEKFSRSHIELMLGIS